MKTFYEKISISMPSEDRKFIKETAVKNRCSISKFIQDIINEYRDFEAYRKVSGDDAST